MKTQPRATVGEWLQRTLRVTMPSRVPQAGKRALQDWGQEESPNLCHRSLIRSRNALGYSCQACVPLFAAAYLRGSYPSPVLCFPWFVWYCLPCPQCCQVGPQACSFSGTSPDGPCKWANQKTPVEFPSAHLFRRIRRRKTLGLDVTMAMFLVIELAWERSIVGPQSSHSSRGDMCNSEPSHLKTAFITPQEHRILVDLQCVGIQ